MSDPFFQLDVDIAANFSTIQPVSDDYDTDGQLDQFARIDHQHPLSQTLRDAIFNSTLYVKKSGDTMSGALTINAGLVVAGNETHAGNVRLNYAGEALTFGVAGAYQAWYNGGTRIAYLQGNAGGAILNSESGILALMGTGGTNMSGGRVDLGGNGITSVASLSYSTYITMSSGLYVSAGILYVQGVHNARGSIQNDSGAYAPAVRILGSGANFASGWTIGTQMHLEETSGAQHSALTLYTGPTAPIFRAYGPFGDRFDCLNNPNTAYCPIDASAFTVQPSSERFKHDIVTLEDDELLGTIANIKTHKFKMNVPPMTVPLSEKFMDINSRWVSKGKRPLTPTGKCYEGKAEPHDCNDQRHHCYGAPDHPCPITKNDTPRFGIIAEHLHEHVPETVFYGEDELPAGYDVDQVAALAFGGVGALYRKVQDLETQIKDLKAA